MDHLLINHAYACAIPVLDVESGSFQMSLINSFDNELYLLLIEDALGRTETYNDDLIKLYELWLSGERDSFWAMVSEDPETDAEAPDDAEAYTEEQLALVEDFNYKLLDERNLGMRDRALEFMASGQTVFFAVGAAHMANAAGLVQLLQDAGCTVEPFAY